MCGAVSGGLVQRANESQASALNPAPPGQALTMQQVLGLLQLLLLVAEKSGRRHQLRPPDL